LGNIFDQQKFEILKCHYGREAVVKEVNLNITNSEFFEEFKDKIENDRKGEVAFAVERPNGKIIVVRTSFYPKTIYRIPTGGINHGEDIIEALQREVKEELGLQTNIEKFLGVIQFNILHKNKKLNFYSYLFWLKEIGGNILEDALEDEVSEYKEVNKEQLIEIVNILKEFQGPWRNWCIFRAETTGFFIQYMNV
jgi:8-oxo-dGTP pyrophosphatase MutT (NUDIX family)